MGLRWSNRAGNATFAKNLVGSLGSENYYAYNNALDDCADFFTASMVEISKIDGYTFPYTLIPNLAKLNSLCKVSSDSTQEVNLRFLMFLAKMAEEHTTAYTNYFFQGAYSSLKPVVAKYTAAP